MAPQASRYTNGAPDLGYYYDALDYSVANLTLSGGNLTVLPGTAIAVRNDYIPNGCWQGIMKTATHILYVEGIVVQQGASFVSHGTPTKPNIFTAEKMVQEFPETDFSEDQIIIGMVYGLARLLSSRILSWMITIHPPRL